MKATESHSKYSMNSVSYPGKIEAGRILQLFDFKEIVAFGEPLVAGQLGHSLDVSQNVHPQSPSKAGFRYSISWRKASS
jgi:hypothetical protein